MLWLLKYNYKFMVDNWKLAKINSLSGRSHSLDRKEGMMMMMIGWKRSCCSRWKVREDRKGQGWHGARWWKRTWESAGWKGKTQRIGRGGGGCCVELPANTCVSRENGHKTTVVLFVVSFSWRVKASCISQSKVMKCALHP